MTEPIELSHMKKHDAIRQAWRKGKKQVTLRFGKQEITFNLTKQVKKINYQTGPTNAKEPKVREDTNVIARPADGTTLPRLNTHISSKPLDG